LPLSQIIASSLLPQEGNPHDFPFPLLSPVQDAPSKRKGEFSFQGFSADEIVSFSFFDVATLNGEPFFSSSLAALAEFLLGKQFVFCFFLPSSGDRLFLVRDFFSGLLVGGKQCRPILLFFFSAPARRVSRLSLLKIFLFLLLFL